MNAFKEGQEAYLKNGLDAINPYVGTDTREYKDFELGWAKEFNKAHNLKKGVNYGML